MKSMKRVVLALMALAIAVSVAADPAPDSKRLALAKDYIADEQWMRAITELRVVANDASDANRDEALFWLAHSENQARDDMAAIETISRRFDIGDLSASRPGIVDNSQRCAGLQG